MFGSIIIWPISSTVIVALMYWQSGQISELIGIEWFESFGSSSYSVALAIIMTWLLMFPLSLLSGSCFPWFGMTLSTFGVYRKQRMSASDKEELFKIIGELKQDLSS